MKRLCLDCSAAIAVTEGSHCAACKARIAAATSRRHNAEFAGSGGAWQALRRQVFDRQEGRCARCGRELSESFEVDHIVPREEGGPSVLENLQALHRNCHLGVTQQRRAAKRKAMAS